MAKRVPRKPWWTGQAAKFVLATLLGGAAFALYAPSLFSEFVYDTGFEFQEGFITSLANLPAILSLKVLGMPLILASRPGSMLYLMLIAAVSGRDPLGYHFCGNLLHAANGALLFLLLLRLTERNVTGTRSIVRLRLAAAAVTLLFVVHPLSVETVANIGYSSDLLVVFFTLAGLLAATAFDPKRPRAALALGAGGAAAALAAVTCKESGIAVAALLIVYWFLFRRREALLPWLIFLGASVLVTVVFLVLRFECPPTTISPDPLLYVGGSFGQMLLIQPRLWVFMLGKFFWPVGLSPDYTLDMADGVRLAPALLVLALLLAGQIWLARASRLGALGVATYWIGLATVSNLLPLFCIEADRYYYLPMAGVAMQLLALSMRVIESPRFWWALGPLVAALVPLTVATVNRQPVFANDVALWIDALRVNPKGLRAYRNLGTAYETRGKSALAIAADEKALALDPEYFDVLFNLGAVYVDNREWKLASDELEKVVELKPHFMPARMELGLTLGEQGRMAEAATQFEEVLRLDPGNRDAETLLQRARAATPAH